VERRRRVVERHVGDVTALDEAAVDMRDRTLAWHQPLERMAAEDEDDLGLDHRELARQVWRASLRLVWHRVTVLRRPALEHVGDVDVGAAQADARQQGVEQLPGGTDERLPLAVFVEARRLSDDQDVGRTGPNPGNGLGSRGMEPALGAGADLGVELLKISAKRL
jgi:hypothetical protein